MSTRWGGFLDGLSTSIRSSSASRRAKPREWTRNNGCCLKCAGRRWKTPDSIQNARPVRKPASLLACVTVTTF